MNGGRALILLLPVVGALGGCHLLLPHRAGGGAAAREVGVGGDLAGADQHPADGGQAPDHQARDQSLPAKRDVAAFDGSDLTLASDAGDLGYDLPCACLIAGACVAANAVSTSNPCLRCDPASSSTSWTLFAGHGCVTTLAGSSNGFADGPVTSARFNRPTGVAVANGIVYVADIFNNRIRAISGGLVTTVAGSGLGYLDGPVSKALFRHPFALAVNASGELAVAESLGNRVRKISAGVVSTVAGDGSAGFADGPTAASKVNTPMGVAWGASGEIYFGDDSCRVRMAAAGLVSTIAGSGLCSVKDGPVGSAAFSDLGPITRSGNALTIGDLHYIRSLTIGGTVTTLAGGFGYANGTGTAAKFQYPLGVALAGTKVYIADNGNHAIRVLTGTTVTTLAGDPALPGLVDGPVAQARFNHPVGVAVDPAGTVYIADQDNNCIRVYTP